MNKIVREHYPVSKLPEELRDQFAGLDTVTLTVTAEFDKAVGNPAMSSDYRQQYAEMMSRIKPMTFKELWEDRNAHPEKYRGEVTIEEAVARIRRLRDEWDDDR